MVTKSARQEPTTIFTSPEGRLVEVAVDGPEVKAARQDMLVQAVIRLLVTQATPPDPRSLYTEANAFTLDEIAPIVEHLNKLLTGWTAFQPEKIQLQGGKVL